jgi:hypothetical protein
MNTSASCPYRCSRHSRHFHGGTAWGSLHSPRSSWRASSSNHWSGVSYGADCRDHQAIPALTSSWLRLRPSGKSTSPTTSPERSVSRTSTVTTCWNASALANCRARIPKACVLSGVSMPCKRTVTAWPFRRTLRVSPSLSPTTFPVKVSWAGILRGMGCGEVLCPGGAIGAGAAGICRGCPRVQYWFSGHWEQWPRSPQT